MPPRPRCLLDARFPLANSVAIEGALIVAHGVGDLLFRQSTMLVTPNVDVDAESVDIR